MKKKILLAIAMVSVFVCLFALAVSAATETIDGVTYSLNNGYASVTNANQKCTLETVIIPDTVVGSDGKEYIVNRLDQSAFQNNTTIKYVSISKNVTYVGPAAFHSCTNLAFVDFNDNQNDVEFNNWGAFMNCTNLKAISLPDKTDIITNRFFSKCTSLQAVYLPSATKTIESNGYGEHTAFYNCYEMYFVNEPFEVRDENGNFYGDNFVMPEKPEIYYFPSNLTNIFKRDSGIGFAFCYNLNSVMVMPETLTQFWINDGVFYCCGDRGNKTTVVFLGDMTDLRIGMRDSRAKGISYIFANPADTDFSKVTIVNSNPGYGLNLNGDEFIYFCKTGKGINIQKPSSNDQFTNDNTELIEMSKHLYAVEVKTLPTCTEEGVTGYKCFCGLASTESTVVPALGHEANELLNKYFASVNGTLDYYSDMITEHSCTRCDAIIEGTEAGTALFTKKGYSYSENDATTFSYTIYVNQDAIKAYNEALLYGIVVSANANGAPISYADGAISHDNKTIAIEFQNTDVAYSIITAKLTGVTATTELHLSAYCVDNGAVSYLGHSSVDKIAEIISYEALLEKYPDGKEE